MAVHVYCVTSPAVPPPSALTGVNAAPVYLLALGEDRSIGAWFSEGAMPSSPTIEMVRAHDAVVGGALDVARSVVPMRFGQRFADERACRSDLTEKAAQLQRALDRVAGCVEMSVIVPLPKERPVPSTDDAHTGRGYLESVRERLSLERNLHSLADAIKRRVHATVAGHVRGEAVRIATSPAAVLTLSHLIDRSALTDYRHALAPLARDASLAGMVISGPSAAYSFVTLE